MTAVYFNRAINDDQRRQQLFSGDLFVYAANEYSLQLIHLARSLIEKAFPGIEPRFAQHSMDARAYANVLSTLKPSFIHHPECKRIIPKLLESLGCDLSQTYFDVPRMRSSTSNNFLTTGIAYAFHPHRDTWYSAPMCQINFWIPIYDISAGNAMAFHPNHWSNPVLNNSEIYNYQEWNAKMRFNAADQVGKDERPQPKPQQEVAMEPSVVAVTPPGGVLLFSAAQLHSSIPNQTGETRFSIDFRTVHSGDLKSLNGAPNIDSKCTGSAINDYLQGSTLDHLPDEIQDLYMPGHPQPVLAPKVTS